MKKVLSVLCAILLVSAMTVSAFAEAVPSPGVEAPEIIEIIVTDKDGNVVDVDVEGVALYMLSFSDEKTPEEVRAAMDEGAVVFEGVNSIEEILVECVGMEVMDIMFLSLPEEIEAILEAGGSVSLKLDMKMELAEDAKMQIVRFNDAQWAKSETESVEILEDGYVVLNLNQAGVLGLLIG